MYRAHLATIRSAALILIAIASCRLYAEAVEIELPAAIESIDDFVAFRDGIASTPEGGAAAFILALLLYEIDETLGHDATVVALDSYELRSDPGGYRWFTLGNRAKEFVTRYLIPKPYLARSYLTGTSPDDGYEAPDEWKVSFTRNAYSVISEERVKVFVACSGADSPRPITLQRNNRGVWKAYEFSSLFVGVRAPLAVIDDPL